MNRHGMLAAVATLLIAVAGGPAIGQNASSGHGAGASTAYMDAMSSMNRTMAGMRMTPISTSPR
ncbi:hypothetical protein [Inquilinus sp.]|uniref:hypothetical protein n=1 Tax=Inquilinus sp. TaxID=1932117 RepID=UPI0031DBA7ED